MQRRVGLAESLPGDTSKVCVAGVTRLMLGEAQHRERRDHRVSPAVGFAVEALNQQDMLVHRPGELHLGDVQPTELREPHGDVLALHNRVGVARGTELCDESSRAILGLPPSAARPRLSCRAAGPP